MQFHDRDWMPWRVLRKDQIVGTNSQTLDVDKGNLELSIHNIIVACLFHYNSAAPYIVQRDTLETLAVSTHHKNTDILQPPQTVLYDVQRSKAGSRLTRSLK